MESYFPGAIKQRIKSHVTANSASVVSCLEEDQIICRDAMGNRKRETVESEPYSKAQNMSDGWRRENLVRGC